MKKITLLFTVCAGLLLASCGGSKVENTPEAVAKAFLAKMQKADYGGAKKYATKESQEALEGMKSMMDMAGSMGGGKDSKMKDAKMEVGTATVNGDEATVPVTSDGKGKTLKLKKEDGNWKVAFSKADASKDGMENGTEKGRENMENIENMGDTLNKSLENAGDTLEKAMKMLNDPKMKESMDKLKESLEKMKSEN